jgi:membrane protein YdbS with pleckstrin-like domain
MAVPTGMNGTTGKRGPTWPVTVGVYSALFLFGAVQGLIGSFQYSRTAGSVPVAALVCCAVILATCLLGAWATRSVSGAVLPGIGWIIASFVLSMPVSNGSVIITSTTAGKWYLYGGTLCVAAGVVASFIAAPRWAGRT